MQAIKDIFRIGRGPSSSHTIGPKRAVEAFLAVFGELDYYIVELYGSLSFTGKGHKTDEIIKEVLTDKVEVVFCDELGEDKTNHMVIKGYRDDIEVAAWHVESLGGGAIRIEEYDIGDEVDIYEHDSFNAIKTYTNEKCVTLLEYIKEREPDLIDHLENCIDVMIDSVKRGLDTSGILNDKLNVYRRAKDLYNEGVSSNDIDLKRIAYAYAAGEENAAGHIVCTGPTLGSCGVATSFAYTSINDDGYSKKEVAEALAVGGLFAGVIKKNATISGAMGGCQAEIGTACALVAGALAYLNGQSTEVIEYAAEVGIEHHLGLTCDPVFGLVIIPCIERNAVAILRAYDACKLATAISKTQSHSVSFDMVVNSMNYTGKMISPELRETGLGGLALEFKEEDWTFSSLWQYSQP